MGLLTVPIEMIENDHIPLLTNGEFIRLELQEIILLQDKLNCTPEEAAEQWIHQHEYSIRKFWSPFVFTDQELIEKAREEIARHRWIESEKVGRDVGIQAELEWIFNHKMSFVSYWQREICS